MFKYLLLFVLVGSLSVWVYSRWNVWFVSAPEEPYACAAEPERVALLPSSDFASQRIVTWRCADTIAASSVIVAAGADTSVVEAQGQIVKTDGGCDAFYRAVIDVAHGSHFSYKVTTGDKESEWYSSATPANGEIRKLLYIGDVQDTVGGLSPRVLHGVFDANRDADAVLFGGDLVEAPLDRYWSNTFNYLDSIATSIPMIVASGNHEYRKGFPPSIDARWPASFAYDANGAAMSPACYSIEAPNVLIAVLDVKSMVRGIPVVSQYLWLRNLLASAKPDQRKIVMLHFPLYSVRPGKNNYLERWAFGSLACDYDVDFVLTGHEHGYMRKVDPDDGTPVYVLSHCSPKNYKLKDADDGEVIIGGRRMYQTITFDADSVRYRAYDATDGALLDYYSFN